MAQNLLCFDFVKAIENGNFARANLLLAQDTENACIQPVSDLKVTALQVAAWQGNIDLVNKLIDKKANVNSVDSIGRSALYYAADRGYADITRRLIECEAQINIQVGIDCSRDETEDLSGISVESNVGQNLPHPECLGRTPLHQAVLNNHVDVVRHLVKNGAYVDCPDERFTTPLLLAGTAVNPKDDSTAVKLWLKNFFDIVTILVSAGANIDRLHKNTGRTVLHHATTLGSVETIELLLTKGARIFQCEKFENTPLHIAARAGDTKALLALCNWIKDYEIGMRDHMDRTALHRAAFHGHRECVKILINHGADLTAAMKTGNTTISDIFTHILQPVELLTDILDSHVHMIDNSLAKYEDVKSKIEIDFKILIPFNQEMAVVMAIIDAASGISHLKILQHPLVETFLTLKWRRLKIFFLFLMLVHFSFVVCLTIFALMFIENNTSDILLIPKILYVCSFFLLVHNLVQLLLEPKHYLKQVETWLSILCAFVSFVTAIGSEVANCDKKEIEKRQCGQWILHCLCMAILLSWMQTMLLIGRFSMWGYYALMFSTVLKNILQVIVIFGFLIVGFALNFMIVFYGKDQFDTFWKAIMSTLVMITGEYEYIDLFKNSTSTDLFNNSTSTNGKTTEEGFLPITARIIFFSFIILASIILINLMTAVAISDIQALEKEGHIRRLVKQAEFIAHVERLTSHKVFNNKWMNYFYVKLLMYLKCDIFENKDKNEGKKNNDEETKSTMFSRSKYLQLQYSAIPTHLMEALNLLAIKTSQKGLEESLKFDDRKFVSMIIEMITNLEEQVKKMKTQICYAKSSKTKC